MFFAGGRVLVGPVYMRSFRAEHLRGGRCWRRTKVMVEDRGFENVSDEMCRAMECSGRSCELRFKVK
eukprot:747919-Hanusia_phi.AAC.2